MGSLDEKLALAITMDAAREYAKDLAEVRRKQLEKERETRMQIGKVLLPIDEKVINRSAEIININSRTTIDELALDSVGMPIFLLKVEEQFTANRLPFNSEELKYALQDGTADYGVTIDGVAKHLTINAQRITTIQKKSKK